MYTPKIYQDHDPESIQKFIRDNGFGILISTVNGELWATHTPMMLSNDGSKLIGHISRGNKQWKDTSGFTNVLAIFNGPHTYVSSSWYNHVNVPTWNYLAVHAYGTVHIIEGEELYASLGELVDKYEKASEHPISMTTMTREYVTREMKGVTGFEISIQRIEATRKLSQNRDDVNHQRIVEQLEKKEDQGAREIAALMKDNRTESK
jgi:transcriptional regulator